MKENGLKAKYSCKRHDRYSKAYKASITHSYNIAWYEQKAVIVLLALLYLGVKSIHLGPILPGFLSPNVATVLIEKFGIAGIGTAEDDIQLFMGN